MFEVSFAILVKNCVPGVQSFCAFAKNHTDDLSRNQDLVAEREQVVGRSSLCFALDSLIQQEHRFGEPV